MIIVQGIFRVSPEDRERFLEEKAEAQRISRQEQGCCEYVFAADPLDPERVVLSELWETQADLDAHAAAGEQRAHQALAAGHTPIVPLSAEVRFFEATEYTP